jgi:hypothetical protein
MPVLLSLPINAECVVFWSSMAHNQVNYLKGIGFGDVDAVKEQIRLPYVIQFQRHKHYEKEFQYL